VQYPDNAGYMIAAYVVAAVVVLVYAVSLFVRLRQASR
jgi:isoprenylcysteine carboxyl methyltransferase (ICMT) family protein YpbQ